MKELDYIVVGLGIAGISFCEQLIENNKSFIVFDKESNRATANSGGVMNPTVLKRFSAAWKIDEFLPVSTVFYQKLTSRLNKEVVFQKPIYRILTSIEEQNNWSVASDKNRMKPFLSPNFIKNENPFIQAPFGYGEVLNTMQIDAHLLLASYKSLLIERNSYIQEDFEYDDLKVDDSGITYKNIFAKRIVFCEGPSAMENPFFPKNKLTGNKGEYIIIEAPDLNLDVLLKGPVYVIPFGKSTYKVGATFTHNDYTWTTTQKAKEEILSHLDKVITCPYKVVGQTVGIRATTFDRHPLIGSHQEISSIGFLNGLGTRGFLMAPSLAELLYSHLEEGTTIPKEMNINR